MDRKMDGGAGKNYKTAQFSLYVGNIYPKAPVNVVKNSIFKLFSAHGIVIDICIPRQFRKKGYAFVAFDRVDSAKAARTALHGSWLMGHRLVVNEAHRENLNLMLFIKNFPCLLTIGKPFEELENRPNFCLGIRGFPLQTLLFTVFDVQCLVKRLAGFQTGHVLANMAFVEFKTMKDVFKAYHILNGVELATDVMLHTSIHSLSEIQATYDRIRILNN